MRLRVLGCSGGIGAWRRTTSYLVGDEILLDAGTGVGELELDELRRIRHVFVTHSHLDHVAALPLLVDTVFQELPTPVVVHAQPVTIQALQEHVLNWTIWPDFAELPDKQTPILVYEPLRPGEAVTVGETTFEMVAVDHAVPGVAYVVSQAGRSFCFSGDTSTNDTLWAALNARERLDLLVVECGFPDEDERLAHLAKHYCPKLLAADLKKLSHRPVVALTHFKPGAEAETLAQCRAAIEGFELVALEHGQTLEV